MAGVFWERFIWGSWLQGYNPSLWGMHCQAVLGCVVETCGYKEEEADIRWARTQGGLSPMTQPATVASPYSQLGPRVEAYESMAGVPHLTGIDMLLTLYIWQATSSCEKSMVV